MSKRIRVIFYKAKWGDKHWLDNAINTWTWLISAKNRKVGPYSHVEIWTPDEDGDFKHPPEHPRAGSAYFAGFVGTMWTSTMRGKDNGTVKRPACDVIKNAKRWDYFEIEVSDRQYEHLISCMKIEVDNNMGYAKKDLWKFILGDRHNPDDSRNICSEFVNNMLYFINVFISGFGIVSPRRLAYKLIQAGYTAQPLDRSKDNG